MYKVATQTLLQKLISNIYSKHKDMSMWLFCILYAPKGNNVTLFGPQNLDILTGHCVWSNCQGRGNRRQGVFTEVYALSWLWITNQSIFTEMVCLQKLFAYFLLSRPTNAQHIYINNILHIISTITCFDASASSSGSLNFYFAKFTKIVKFTYWIKSLD
jgi:hypothetical protein